MRNYVIPCRDCELEFDGTEDGPKAYVHFCPLHANAEHMKRALEVLRDNALSDTERNFINLILSPVEQEPVEVKLTPIAPGGTPLVGSPVAPGASLRAGGERQA